MSVSKEISSSAQSFFAFECFSLLLTIFCFFALLLSVIFSSFDFLWHATDYWHSNVSKNVRNTLQRICFTLIAMIKNQMLDETAFKCIQHENLVWWTRKCWMKSLIKNKLHPTSSFFFFMNFLISQIHPTFRPISKNYNVGWNVRCTCVGLYSERIIYGFTWKYLRVEYWLLQTYWLDRQWVHYLYSCYLIKGTMLAVMKLNIRNYYFLICDIMLIQAFL